MLQKLNIFAKIKEKRIDDEATQWAIKWDRGFSPEEQEAFDAWLAGGSRHEKAFNHSIDLWGCLDELSPEIARQYLSPENQQPEPASFSWVASPMKIAAAIVCLSSIASLVWFFNASDSSPAPEPLKSVAAVEALPSAQQLPDGSFVKLNQGTEFELQFNEEVRRVNLRSGEAHFQVVKDYARPFVVNAQSVSVEAIGTAFNVKLKGDQVAVLVTDGVVQMSVKDATQDLGAAPQDEGAAQAREEQILSEGQMATVAIDSGRASSQLVSVKEVSSDEISTLLVWQKTILALGGKTLQQIIAQFESASGRRIVLNDKELAGLRIGGSFDFRDLDGFISILELNYSLPVYVDEEGAVFLGEK